MVLQNVYGLDLGTYDIKVYDKKRDLIWQEKNAIAKKNPFDLFATGDDAYRMFGKTPKEIEVVFPMREGVIARFQDMQQLLDNVLKKERPFSKGAEYLVAVPTDVTQVEKKAFFDLVMHSAAKAKSVRIVEHGIADAIGAGLPVNDLKGAFIVNIGGGATELSVVSYGGIVLNRLLKTGGEAFDQAIVSSIRRNCDFLIGRITAEKLRKQMDLFAEEDATISVSGRNLLKGVPQYQEIPVRVVKEAMKFPLTLCTDAIQSLLQRTPPDIRRTITEEGIYLTGGFANLKGLPQYLEEEIGLKVHLVPDPELCTVRGLKAIIQDKEDYKKRTYSMLDEDYRWLR